MKDRLATIVGAVTLLVLAACATGGSPQTSDPAFTRVLEKQKAEERAAGILVRDITLAVGTGRMFEFPFTVGPVFLTNPALFDYKRVVDGGEPHKMILIGKRPGVTDLTIHDAKGTALAKLYVQVAPAGDEKSIEAQKAEERAQGVEIAELDLAVGISRTLEFPFEIGPLHLGNPALFDYRRVLGEGGRDKKLHFLPRAAGITDLVIHDAEGKPRMKYYIRVAGSPIALPATRQPASRRPLSQPGPRFYDLVGSDVQPVY